MEVNEITVINRTVGKKMYLVTKMETDKYLLKHVESEERLIIEEDLLQYLSIKGLKVFPPIRNCKNELTVEYKSDKYCLYKFIEGEHLEYNTFEKLRFAAENFGRILGRLHKELKEYKNSSTDIKDMNLYHSIFNWSLPKIEEKMKDTLVYVEIEKQRSKLEQVFEIHPKQFIHRDFHGENVMFKDSEFVGIIDFEICMVGYRLFDIGYLLTSMLVGDFYDENYRNEWLEILPILIKSYNEVNNLAVEEKHDIYYMLLCVELVFIAYYLNRDDMDGARKNLEMLKWFLLNEKKIAQKLLGVDY